MGNKNLSGNGGEGEESRVQNSPKAFGELKTFEIKLLPHKNYLFKKRHNMKE